MYVHEYVPKSNRINIFNKHQKFEKKRKIKTVEKETKLSDVKRADKLGRPSSYRNNYLTMWMHKFFVC